MTASLIEEFLCKLDEVKNRSRRINRRSPKLSMTKLVIKNNIDIIEPENKNRLIDYETYIKKLKNSKLITLQQISENNNKIKYPNPDFLSWLKDISNVIEINTYTLIQFIIKYYELSYLMYASTINVKDIQIIKTPENTYKLPRFIINMPLELITNENGDLQNINSSKIREIEMRYDAFTIANISHLRKLTHTGIEIGLYDIQTQDKIYKEKMNNKRSQDSILNTKDNKLTKDINSILLISEQETINTTSKLNIDKLILQRIKSYYLIGRDIFNRTSTINLNADKAIQDNDFTKLIYLLKENQLYNEEENKRKIISKGRQEKYYHKGFIYKFDFKKSFSGYNEYITARLLEYSNAKEIGINMIQPIPIPNGIKLSDFCKHNTKFQETYEILNEQNVMKSLKDNNKEISMDKFITVYYKLLQKTTNLDFINQLMFISDLDVLLLNTDRFLNMNWGFINDNTGKSFAPVFDNSDILLSGGYGITTTKEDIDMMINYTNLFNLKELIKDFKIKISVKDEPIKEIEKYLNIKEIEKYINKSIDTNNNYTLADLCNNDQLRVLILSYELTLMYLQNKVLRKIIIEKNIKTNKKLDLKTNNLLKFNANIAKDLPSILESFPIKYIPKDKHIEFIAYKKHIYNILSKRLPKYIT